MDLSCVTVWKRGTIEEELFVITIPGISLVRESVGSIWSALVVTVIAYS